MSIAVCNFETLFSYSYSPVQVSLVQHLGPIGCATLIEAYKAGVTQDSLCRACLETGFDMVKDEKGCDGWRICSGCVFKRGIVATFIYYWPGSNEDSLAYALNLPDSEREQFLRSKLGDDDESWEAIYFLLPRKRLLFEEARQQPDELRSSELDSVWSVPDLPPQRPTTISYVVCSNRAASTPKYQASRTAVDSLGRREKSAPRWSHFSRYTIGQNRVRMMEEDYTTWGLPPIYPDQAPDTPSPLSLYSRYLYGNDFFKEDQGERPWRYKINCRRRRRIAPEEEDDK